MSKREPAPNQLYRELQGVLSLSPFPGHNAASRQQMFSSHIGQALVIKGATERRIQTGMEREYGKYTFSIKMPVDAEIIRVVERYRSTVGSDSIAFNPQTVVIYEDVATKEIGVLSIPRYCSYHQYFGFEYKPHAGLAQLRPQAFIAKDTILMDSPSITPEGGYKYGTECNMAFMSHPAVSEDGIMISRDVLPRFAIYTYETRVVEWGSKRMALNLYGDEKHPRPFPDIGEPLREGGLLMALRSYEKDLAVIEQGIHDLREPDLTFDKLTYASGEGGVVVDIRVQHDIHNAPVMAPGQVSMDTQPEKYDKARRQFYAEIVGEYNRLRRERGEMLRLTPEFHRMLVEALAVVENDPQRIIKLYRQAPLDDWRIEFVIRYEITPTIGFKLTDTHGGKGVICHIAEPHEMPVDEMGNRADIVMDPNSTVSRMNLGRLYEQYFNSVSRDVASRIRELLAVSGDEKKLSVQLSALETQGDERFEKAWSYLIGYYQRISPKMYVWMTSGEYKQSRAHHLASIIKDGIYIYYPPNNDPETEHIVAELERYYKPTYGPVSYIGYSGKRVVTKNPVRIGSVYMILLEKIGDDWTAVSSGKTQHFGVLSQVTNLDKFATPTRQQAIRAWGESEVRIAVSYVGPQFVAEMMDRNNNSDTHKQILRTLLQSEKPTNVQTVVDRTQIPLGGAKPLSLVRHIAECGGWKFVYNPHIPSWELPIKAGAENLGAQTPPVK